MVSARTPRSLAEIFFLSGISALVYQVVWQRLLTLHHGVGTVAQTYVVSIFLLGMGLGARLGGRLADRPGDALVRYALVELAIGVFGLASIPMISSLARPLVIADGVTAMGLVALVLIVPTTLMGMTLPLMTVGLTRLQPQLGASVSMLYFWNTAGAALGALLGAFVLITYGGLDVATYAAAAMNGALAFAAWRLSARGRATPGEAARGDAAAAGPVPGDVALEGPPEALETEPYIAPMLLVSGAVAIGYQIIWFRLVTLLTKDSPYAFATTLAIYLLGLALGSEAVHRGLKAGLALGRASVFAACQLGIAAYSALLWRALVWLTDHGLLRDQITYWFDYGDQVIPWSAVLTRLLVVPAVIFLVPTLLMGASFPVAAMLARRASRGDGRTVGDAYFANVVGNAAGGLLTGFWLLPVYGSERSLAVLAAVGCAFAARTTALARLPAPARAAATALCVAVIWVVSPGPGEVIARLHPPAPPHTMVFSEGLEGVVVTYTTPARIVNFINGQAHGGYPNPWMYNEAIETARWSKDVQDVLVIGYGTGSTVDAILKLPEVKRLTLVEINETLIQNLRRIPIFARMLADPRLELVIADGRRWLDASPRHFDLILMDPLRTTTAYSNNLYSREFFEILSRHLSPGGAGMIWFDEAQVLPRTAATVFRELRVYGYFLVAANDPLNDHLARRDAILSKLSPKLRALVEGEKVPVLAGDRASVLADTDGLPINTDLRPVTEYYRARPPPKEPTQKEGAAEATP